MAGGERTAAGLASEGGVGGNETEDKMMDGPTPTLAEGVPTLTTMLTLMSKI